MYSFNESLPFLLTRTGAAMAGVFAQELKDLGLTMPMWRILAALWSNGDQSLGSLAELTSTEMSTMSRQVASLIRVGLASRHRSKVDWRSINIGLTGQGRNMVEQLLPVVERHEHVAFDGISAADARRLRQLLNKVYANIKAFDETAAAEPDDPGRHPTAP